MALSPVIVVGILAAFFLAGVRVLQEYERGVVFRLGRFAGVKPAGFRWIVPMVDRMVKVSLREIVMDVPAQEVITRDNVSLKVNAVLYFRVLHPEKAVIQVENYLYGTSQLSQTTLRSRPAPGRARQRQSPAPGDHRHRDRAVGGQGARCRGEADRSAARDAASDGEAGRGRA
jgi:regulator of protease activity HflC (stomatin/prohibitin superfamily)